MSTIRPISDLRNHADEISRICHKKGEPVFITKNGHGDMVVMSLALYEKQKALVELYRKLEESERGAKSPKKWKSHKDMMATLRNKLA